MAPSRCAPRRQPRGHSGSASGARGSGKRASSNLHRIPAVTIRKCAEGDDGSCPSKHRPAEETTVTRTDPTAPGEATVITVVRAPACHLCEDATAALGELGRKFPVRVQLMEAGETDGAALVRQHRA